MINLNKLIISVSKVMKFTNGDKFMSVMLNSVRTEYSN